MKIIKSFGIITIGVIIMLVLGIGCATTVPIKSVKMPTIDTSSIKKLAIAEFKDSGGGGAQITRYLSDKTKELINGTGKFEIVSTTDPNADGVFIGEVRNFGARDSQEQRQWKDKEGNVQTETIYRRDVSLEFSYSVKDTRKDMEINTVVKRGSTYSSSNDPSRVTDAQSLARQIVDAQLGKGNFEKDIVPTIVSTNRKLMDETSKDKIVKQLMKMALALVKNGELEEAIKQYDEIANEHGSVAAKTNAKILREAIASDIAATELMAQLDAERQGLADKAIKNAIDSLDSKLPSGENITIMKTQSTEQDMLDYVVDQMTKNVLQTGKLKIIDRSNQTLIQAEQQFQLSGNVSDDTAISIGQQLGVKYILFCWISGEKSGRRLNLKLLNIETAQITSQTDVEI
jgi:hypothetical protein